MPINELREFFKQLQLTEYENSIARRILIEINNRLNFLCDVGLEYLTLNRLSASLSGGESQRINLATSLGSSLVGSLYILDEPSIGLHPRDTRRLISVLRKLQQIGNTVLVVEHDEEIIRAADQIIDIGPYAGSNGGKLVFQGACSQLSEAAQCLTADYLTGRRQIPVPKFRRKWNDSINIIGARENNLRNLTVSIPLNVMTAITGVSGSGKSTLVSRILYPALTRLITGSGEAPGAHDAIRGAIKSLKAIEFVDQNPIGKSSRSNPVTYLKAYDEIRKLFAELPTAIRQGFKPAHFSFNVDGGRCEACEGEGEIHVEMQFMADVRLVCEHCHGKRFKQEILEIEYHGQNIHDILEMTVDEAITFFSNAKNSAAGRIAHRLQPLQDVGLGYVRLGQSSSTLSGGESQRVKLAYFLSKEKDEPTMFIFDEPTTGLHFHDIHKLLESLNALISRGHSVVIIEHNPDVIKCADWVIDLGPEGGKNGGSIVFEGPPEALINCEKSHTGQALKEKLT
jgi:excinuclease ABC subunit A